MGPEPAHRRGSQTAERIDVQHQPDEGQRDRRCLRQERAREEHERRRIPRATPEARRRGVHRAQVGERRPDREQRRENIPSRADPDHGLRPERMHREQQSGNSGRQGERDRRCRGGRRAREFVESTRQPVDERRGRPMAEQAGEVIADRIVPPHEVVGAPRHPRERLVETRVRRRPHPAELAPPQAVDLRVVAQLLKVVEREEVPAQCRQEDEDRTGADEQGRQEVAGLRSPHSGGPQGIAARRHPARRG